MSTFGYQDQLPKLPIPEIQDTCERYLQAVETLQTEEEHEQTKIAVETFLNTDGPVLQEKLKEYAKDKTSYVEDFWNDAYLATDGSVVLNLNPFFVLEDDPTPSRNNQLARAASLILSSLKFVSALRSEALEPDIWRNTPLCMNQFKFLFGCSRFPTLARDEVHLDSKSKHIAVLCRSQFYYFDVMWEDGSIAITEQILCENLRAIQEDASATSDANAAMNAVGVLTTEHRSKWAELRQVLVQDNEEALRVVDSALFLVCLDNTSPPTAADFAATALHGTYAIRDGVQVGSCINRWYDKLQIIVCENGVAGVNFEHSTVDGHTVLRFVSDIFTDTIIRFAQTIRGGTQSLFKSSYVDPTRSLDPNRPHTSPRKLEWVLRPKLLFGIRYAEAQLSDLILQNEVHVLEFTSYGKLFITQHDLSPDAFVQMAFVASYYSLYGSPANTYEPVLTKKFRHGRTEAARSMTPEAKAFVKTFCGDSSPLEKILALRAAVRAQVTLVRRCAQGLGVDRHLYSLKCLWDREARVNSDKPTPALFADAGWERLNETILSTSNCGNPSLRLFGFGPVIPQGFGIGYIIKDDGIQFCASSKHRQTNRFLDTLQTYLLEVQALLLEEQRTTYPNLVGPPLSRPGKGLKKQRSIPSSIATIAGGYGFFDSGDTTTDEPARERIGRKL